MLVTASKRGRFPESAPAYYRIADQESDGSTKESSQASNSYPMYLKKAVIILYSGLFLCVVALGARFYWANLRGAKPVIFSPPYDITESINKTIRGEGATSSDIKITELKELPLIMPAGFKIGIFAKDLDKPRVIAFDPNGTLVVSIPSKGQVIALPDKDADGKADKITIVADKLNEPHGLAFRKLEGGKHKLYVGETDKVTVFDYNPTEMKASLPMTAAKLPGGGTHRTRTLMFQEGSTVVSGSTTMSEKSLNERLLVSVGSSCNVCEEKDDLRAKIIAMSPDGREINTFASGLRNTVFFTAHPVTGEIWGADMGRDLLGDNLPPDEINILAEGKDYGWPYCFGSNLHDDEFDPQKKVSCETREPSYLNIQAHSAPLGLAFFPESGWPVEYQNSLLVSLHGSWNRTEPTGYKIVLYRLDRQGNFIDVDEHGNPVMEDFITGWLTKDDLTLGRPVDIKILANGMIFVSDDKAGVIYRILHSSSGAENTADASQPATTPEAAKNTESEIRLTNPKQGEAVKSPLGIDGEAPGSWFFEGVFDAKVLDGDGNELGRGQVQALGDWMTGGLVPFTGKIEYSRPGSEAGALVLVKANPSGLPENEVQHYIRVKFGEAGAVTE